MDAERADGIAYGVAEERILMFSRLDPFAFFRVCRGKYQRAVQGERQRRGEEETHRDHMRRVVVEVQVLVSGIGDPIEMAHDPVGKAMTPGAQ